MVVTWYKQGACGFVELNNPPVNAINNEIREGLLDAVKWAEAEGLERVILSGVGRSFAAGADTKEFDSAAVPPHLPDVVNSIEESKIPWVAALHGAVLGGGAELALACRYRIARSDATIGFPEVILGLVPGAGGTQRLPRLIGFKEALNLISTGKAISGSVAMAIGLVDAIHDSPINAALLIDQGKLDRNLPVSMMTVLPVDVVQYEKAKQVSIKRMRGQDAPLAAISLLETAQTASLAEGMRQERATFLTLRQSPQARALRHIFFAERNAKAPKALRSKMEVPTHVAVVGGGTMGASIAYAFLNAGMTVTILETDNCSAQRASKATEKIILASLASGHIDQQAAADRRARLTVTDTDVNFGKIDLAIEAVFEDPIIKTKVLQRLEAALRPDAIIATNTSYLDVNMMAECLLDPSRLLGLHFFAPAHIMKLIEIIKGVKTSPVAMAMGYTVAKSLGKIPVISGVCDGFIGNRILSVYREAADALLIDGSTPTEIDKAMVAFGYAMGPYETQDLSGLDIAYANRRRQDSTRNPAKRYIPIADRLVLQKRLGQKTGAGWYQYAEGSSKTIDPLVEGIIYAEAIAAKITRRTYKQEEIQRRLLIAMINEAANILHEGIATSAADIDLVLIHGYGFAKWRGGLMHYANQLSPTHILSELKMLCLEDPVFWQPSQLIIECVATGHDFSSYGR